MAPSPNPTPSFAGSPGGSCHYAELKVSSVATPQELRQAFRQLSKLYHPDTTQLPPRQAEAAFARLQLAYATLSDPNRRRAYDQHLALVAATALPTVVAPEPQAAAGRRLSVHRALSGGEWLALLLLGVALILSLVLGLGVAWARGLALVTPPSWSVAGVDGPPEPPLAPVVPQTAKAEPPADAPP
jgi:hypothetical protein